MSDNSPEVQTPVEVPQAEAPKIESVRVAPPKVESVSAIPAKTEVPKAAPVPVTPPKVEPKQVAPVAEQIFASDLDLLKAQVNELAIANLINDYKVPDKLRGLIPNDLGKARAFIESDQYKALLEDLDKVAELERQKAELQAKLDALNHPQQVPATPVPDARTEPAKDIPAKRWEDITPESLSLIGSVLLRDL